MSGARVLIAEDSLVVRAVLRRNLESQGYVVSEANDGEAALQSCRDSKPDVVLLDIEMPGLDGHGVLRALKADPNFSDVPVVFLTGRTDTKDLVEGLRLGAHDYLKKPFEEAELLARVSAAVRVKTLQDELRHRNLELDLISRTDPLTGLYNRRHIEERLEEFGATARRHGFTMGVLMIDIDYFKRVNDSAGHAAGDAVLREFAIRMRRCLREEDVPGRWGGEEFIAIAPISDLDGTNKLGERLRASIAADPFTLDDLSSIDVTMSAGCAVGDGFDIEDLVRRADAALYAAKESGRNRVVADGLTMGDRPR